VITHDLKTVEENCDRAMFLNDGKIVNIGNPQEVINSYIKFFFEK